MCDYHSHFTVYCYTSSVDIYVDVTMCFFVLRIELVLDEEVVK